jgi:glutathione S-transferase
MKLYTYPRAPNPRRVAWLMAEKGISDVEVVPVDIMQGEHRTSEYRGRAGFAHVPALEIDGETTLTESIAICRYLEALYPQPNLLGRNPLETAQIEMWTRRCEMYLANPLMMMTRHTHPVMMALEPPNPAVAEYNRSLAERFMGSLDRRLAKAHYIAGDRFTVADIVAAIGLDFPRLVKYRPPKDLVHLDSWFETMRRRPGFRAV